MMIRSHFGLSRDPFAAEAAELLPHQSEILDILQVHCRQGGLCLVAGEPGSGKSAVRSALQRSDPKRLAAPCVGRTMHAYLGVLKILCQALEVGFEGGDFKCEQRLKEEAYRLNRLGKSLALIIDDAHLMRLDALRRLRLLLEEFPSNQALILFAQPVPRSLRRHSSEAKTMLERLRLSGNADLRSRLTYSAIVERLAPEDIAKFVSDQLQRCGLGSNVLSEDALALIARSSQGYLRAAKHLCVASLIEAVRSQTRTVGLAQVNAALMQPHWREREPVGA